MPLDDANYRFYLVVVVEGWTYRNIRY